VSKKYGRSVRNRPDSNNRLFVIVVILAIFVVLVALLAFLSGGNKQAQSDLSLRTTQRAILANTCAEYMQAGTGNDDWWLVDTQQPPPNLNDNLEIAVTNILNALRSSAAASPLATKVANAFTNILITELVNGQAIAINHGQLDPKSIPNTLEVCFLSETDFRSNKLEQSMLWYRANWDAVMMGAIDWPSPFFDAVLMHEAGHAYQSRTTGQPQMFGREWYEAEVTMHTLESAVLDLKTHGAYTEKIKSICAKNTKSTNAADLLSRVSLEDLLALDEIIRVRDRGHDIRGAACFNHTIAIGFYFIDLHKGSVEDKVHDYRWCIGR